MIELNVINPRRVVVLITVPSKHTATGQPIPTNTLRTCWRFTGFLILQRQPFSWHRTRTAARSSRTRSVSCCSEYHLPRKPFP